MRHHGRIWQGRVSFWHNLAIKTAWHGFGTESVSSNPLKFPHMTKEQEMMVNAIVNYKFETLITNHDERKDFVSRILPLVATDIECSADWSALPFNEVCASDIDIAVSRVLRQLSIADGGMEKTLDCTLKAFRGEVEEFLRTAGIKASECTLECDCEYYPADSSSALADLWDSLLVGRNDGFNTNEIRPIKGHERTSWAILMEFTKGGKMTMTFVGNYD